MTINWADEPLPARVLPHIPLRRIPTSGKIHGVVTCLKPIACHCHYISGRTLPCVSENCPGCALERRRIRECYLTIIVFTSRLHQITVLTPNAERELMDGIREPTNARGAIIEITRQGSKPNGRLQCKVEDERIDPARLPPAPDLEAHLYQIWGLTSELFGSEHPLWEAKEALNLALIKSNGSRLPPVNTNLARPSS